LRPASQSMTDQPPPQLELLMAISADVGELVNMGAAPLGDRRVVYITGGTFAGPLMRGEVVGGADWQIGRRDGALELDARYALREARGGLVQVISQGMRTFMRFETGAPELAFLNTTMALATAVRHARRVELRCFCVV
jgi:hypothetical protein